MLACCGVHEVSSSMERYASERLVVLLSLDRSCDVLQLGIGWNQPSKPLKVAQSVPCCPPENLTG